MAMGVIVSPRTRFVEFISDVTPASAIASFSAAAYSLRFTDYSANTSFPGSIGMLEDVRLCRNPYR